jgi:uncharacterized protein (UPF0147 family)
MPPKKKRVKEYEERIEQAKSVLALISEDRTTPRNIRRAAKEAIKLLTVSDQTQAVRSAQAISLLDDISQDTNMPPYTRTRIWNVVSFLAVIKE